MIEYDELEGKLEDKTRYLIIMTTMNKPSERKTQLMENIQGWQDDDRKKQIRRSEKQRMENTYKDDTMVITMNRHVELDRNWKRKYEINIWWKYDLLRGLWRPLLL
jgi:hypothetical protein